MMFSARRAPGAPTFSRDEYLTDGIGLYRVVEPPPLDCDGLAQLEDCFTLRVEAVTVKALEDMDLVRVG